MAVQIDPQTLKQLDRRHLRYISDQNPGIKRKRNNSAFIYLDANGVKITNQNILQRIEELVIPPAWKDVWISPFAHSHLQVTGIDVKGRKQYVYHPIWIEITQENKFSHLVPFAESLSELRKKVNMDMKMMRLVREKVLATVVWLLEHTFIRVGNEEYAKDNSSYGLTTLRSKHVKFSGKRVKFEFLGKSGVEHSVDVLHPTVFKTIKKCNELAGYELFKYLDEDKKMHVIDSGEVNDYLKGITGEDITAKDFRTWGGTVLSATTLKDVGPWENKEGLKQNLNLAVNVVSEHLRNTAKVCRNYYIHPKIFETYEKNILVPHFKSIGKSGRKLPRLSVNEVAVVSLLKKYA